MKMINYDLALTPGYYFVDVDMTINNLSNDKWTDVWWFNCLSPIRSEHYKDFQMTRTFMSSGNGSIGALQKNPQK